MIISMPFPVRFWVRKMKAAVFATLMLLGMPMQVLGDVADDSSLALKPKKGRALRGAVEVDAHAPSNYTRAGAHSSNYPAAMDGTFLEVSGEAVKPKAGRRLRGAMDFLAASDYPNAHAYELNQTAMYGDFLELSKEATGISQWIETKTQSASPLAVALEAFNLWGTNSVHFSELQTSMPLRTQWSEKAAPALAKVNKMRDLRLRYMQKSKNNADVCADARMFVYTDVVENFYSPEVEEALAAIVKQRDEMTAPEVDSCPSPVDKARSDRSKTKLPSDKPMGVPQAWFGKYLRLALEDAWNIIVDSSTDGTPPTPNSGRDVRGQEIAKKLRVMAVNDLKTNRFTKITDPSKCRAHAYLTKWATLGDELHLEPECGAAADDDRFFAKLQGVEDKPDASAFTKQVELLTELLEEEEKLANELYLIDKDIIQPRSSDLHSADDLLISDWELKSLVSNLELLWGRAAHAGQAPMAEAEAGPTTGDNVAAAKEAATNLRNLLATFDERTNSDITCRELLQEVKEFPQAFSEGEKRIVQYYARSILGRSRPTEYHELAAEAENVMKTLAEGYSAENCMNKFVMKLRVMAKSDVKSESFTRADGRVTAAENTPDEANPLTGSTTNGLLKANRKWVATLKRWAEGDFSVALVEVLAQQEVLRKKLVEAELSDLAARLPSSQNGAEVDLSVKNTIARDGLTNLIEELVTV